VAGVLASKMYLSGDKNSKTTMHICVREEINLNYSTN
jgi:hypothetical protein